MKDPCTRCGDEVFPGTGQTFASTECSVRLCFGCIHSLTMKAFFSEKKAERDHELAIKRGDLDAV